MVASLLDNPRKKLWRTRHPHPAYLSRDTYTRALFSPTLRVFSPSEKRALVLEEKKKKKERRHVGTNSHFHAVENVPFHRANLSFREPKRVTRADSDLSDLSSPRRNRVFRWIRFRFHVETREMNAAPTRKRFAFALASSRFMRGRSR